jgi:acyl carrier protein
VHAWVKGEEKELAAYFVSAAELKATDLRPYLMDRLPAYMIPQHFIQLDKLPLSSSGKIDRKSLPAPKLTKTANYVAPTNATQEMLVNIWAEALDIDKGIIGINSNFFELGGHSLKAVRVISAIEKQFDTRIQLATFFMKPTIGELEQNILMTSVARIATSGAKKITI